MKQHQTIINFTTAKLDEITHANTIAVIEASRAACSLSYAPYSHFHVGAAVLLENGKIVQGGNQENAAYPMCCCAEQVAVHSSSILFPSIPITCIAIHVNVDSHDYPPAPCGACRQVLSEAEFRHQKPLKVILSSRSPLVFIFDSIQDLLPFSFSSKDLNP